MMPRWKPQLQWHKARSCWRKKYKGKDYYLGRGGVAKTDRAAYDEAWKEWEQIKSRVDAQEQRQELDQRTETYQAQQLRRYFQTINSFADEMSELGSTVSESYAQRLSSEAQQLGVADHPDFQLDERVVEKSNATTITHQIDRFLEGYRTQAKLGNRSMNRADNLRRYLGVFSSWRQFDGGASAGDRLTGEINASIVEDFYSHLAERVADEDMAPATAHSTFTAFKQFVHWLWERELCNLPRNIESKLYRIEVPAQQVETWNIEHAKRLMSEAPPRTRLYCLLAANCGMTAKDISDLSPNEVNFRKGTITRQRSKTRRNGDKVPTVTYKLWPETLRLLKEHRSDDQNHVLLSTSGGPLIAQRIKDNGKLARVDVVRLALRRAIESLNNRDKRAATKLGKKPPKPIEGSFTGLRRTSASLLHGHHQHRSVTELWLGHTPKNVRDKHYVDPSQKMLDAAVKWLGSQYGHSI